MKFTEQTAENLTGLRAVCGDFTAGCRKPPAGLYSQPAPPAYAKRGKLHAGLCAVFSAAGKHVPQKPPATAGWRTDPGGFGTDFHIGNDLAGC